MGKLISTIINVAVAVSVSAAVWVGANMLFDQVRTEWRRFNAIVGAFAGFLLFGILHGNRVLEDFGISSKDVGAFLAWVWMPIIGAAIGGAAGWFLATADDPTMRRNVATAIGVVSGVVIGLLIESGTQPAINWVAFIIFTAVFTAIGGGISRWRGRPPVGGAIIGAAVGTFLGGFGAADLGDGTMAEAVIASAAPLGLLGFRHGMTVNPDYDARSRIDRGARPVIFLAPSLFFIFAALIVPTIRTFWLSLLDTNYEEFVWLENYDSIRTDRNSIDISGWTDIFTSRLFWLGLAMLGAALLVGYVSRKRTGRAFELGGPGIMPLLIAATLLVFATLSVLRGTIMNNLWWVFTVTLLSTALGLAIAVLADGARFESVAKSIIFMPMAISLVGASIIWRFMFLARNPEETQTGVMNAVWVSIGKASQGSGLPTTIAIVVLALITFAFGARVIHHVVRRNFLGLPLPAFGTLLFGWLWLQFAGVIGEGFGGAVDTENGAAAAPVFFVQAQPFNSVWLMVILIWIQTGFAMVILSAAIKAVPTELIEAARVDGATESQVFWRVTLPQIATTIGVVVTTLIVLVMKVYDIVKVVTNGNFGTQVLANDFFQKAFFSTGQRSVGAALAVILFLSVLPVMYLNIRRMQQEES